MQSLFPHFSSHIVRNRKHRTLDMVLKYFHPNHIYPIFPYNVSRILYLFYNFFVSTLHEDGSLLFVTAQKCLLSFILYLKPHCSPCTTPLRLSPNYTTSSCREALSVHEHSEESIISDKSCVFALNYHSRRILPLNAFT